MDIQSSTSATINPVNMYDYINSLFMNPVLIAFIMLCIVIFVLFSLGNANENMNGIGMNESNGQSLLTIIIIIILIGLIINGVFQYFFSVSVTTYVRDIFSNQPKIDIDVQKLNPIEDAESSTSQMFPSFQSTPQVFNIPENTYDYESAKALCNAYDARLATYKEVEDAYENGGEWCNYGWSEGQMALFPTQQKTFNKLQKIKGHENDCGRPGVNGGYIANPNIRFGVNCYGKKPKMKKEEEELMENVSPYPVTEEDLNFQRKVNTYKTKIDDILVSPFNYKSWFA